MRTLTLKGRRWLTVTRREALAGYLFVAPSILGLLLWQALPLAAALYLSFTNLGVHGLNHVSWVGLRNYTDLLNDTTFPISVMNTLYYTVIFVPLSIFVGLALAILLNQKIPARSLIRTIFYLPSIMPMVATSTLFLWVFNPDGILSSFLSYVHVRAPYWLSNPNWTKPFLILMGLWGVGGSMVLYLAGLQNVPQELIEAAQIDGAGPVRVFFSITIPMISGVLFFTLVTGLIGTLQYFTQAYVMTNGTGNPVDSLYFYMFSLYTAAFQNFYIGYACAQAWLLFVAVLLLTVVLFKFVGPRVYTEEATGA